MSLTPNGALQTNKEGKGIVWDEKMVFVGTGVYSAEVCAKMTTPGIVTVIRYDALAESEYRKLLLTRC